jgi:hypothetical protein
MFAEMSEYAPETHRRLMCADWVIVRPSTLTDVPAEDKYILGIDSIPKGWRIPREDVAEFTLDQLDDDRYLRRAIAMTT